MRGLFASGLVLALGWAVSPTPAQENVWRPAQQSPPAAATSGGISLRHPLPLEEPPNPPPAAPITPVAFSGVPSGSPPAFARAKTDLPSQPMPVGPSLTGTQPKEGEPIGPPVGPGVPSTPSAGVVSRWIDDGAALHGDGTMMHPGGEGCCPGDCNPCCPCPCEGDGCPNGCWPCNNCCADPSRFWVRGEYLGWWMKSSQAPPLVTASPAGTPLASAGVLGPNSTVLFPASGNFDYGMFSGARFTAGFAVPSMPGLGFEATWFFLGHHPLNFIAASSGSPEISRPINNVNTGLEEAELVAFPGRTAGSVAVWSNSKLWGVEANARYHLLCGCNYRVDLLAGFRFLELDEDLNVTEDLTLTDASVRAPAGTRILVFDTFNTKNSFYGGQIGVDGEYRWQKFFVGGSFKLALGVMHEVVNINGATVFIAPGLAPITQSGGLLAAPTNIGHFSSNRFAVIPEIGLKFGYQVTDHIRVYAGYDFLWVSSVVRPGDQIDRVINRTQLPTVFGAGTLVGAARPMPLFVPR
ncbi:MAG TPA: BBP7 family outer membrane beta-barrel protein, partial [Gemmataceae bacterium]|nr:BBP7 family outer membrane beta-barrel protein [Gemmataceae bacterium]